MKIKIEKFLMKQGNRVGKAAIEFEQTDGLLAGFHLFGFTICDDDDKGMFVLFPAAITNKKDSVTGANRQFFFLRSPNRNLVEKLENEILDIYESMTGPFNKPRMTGQVAQEVVATAE